MALCFVQKFSVTQQLCAAVVRDGLVCDGKVWNARGIPYFIGCHAYGLGHQTNLNLETYIFTFFLYA